MLDHMDFNFDLDGDGIPDSFAEEVDFDGDGIADALLIDSDNNGIADIIFQELDTDGDGIADTFSMSFDTDENGIVDANMIGHLEDTTGDGIADTYVLGLDLDGDAVIDAFEVYDYDPATGLIELENFQNDLDYNIGNGTYIDELENFDPNDVDAGDVSGNPEQSMAEWEYQGATNRCAIYSQKFVIEELTGEDLDIEELADLAEENGWFTEEGGTSMANMNSILDHYGIENEMTFGNNIDDLRECLENGGKVIVSIDADEIWYGENDNIFTPDDGANHAVQVIGIDNSDPDDPMVILNDSGNPDGCGEMVPLDTFVDAWEDGGFQMISCM